MRARTLVLLILAGLLQIGPAPAEESKPSAAAKALRDAERTGSQAAIAEALRRLAVNTGDARQARRHLERALGIERTLGKTPNLVETLLALATVGEQVGDLERAKRAISEASMLSETVGEGALDTRIRIRAGSLALATGDVQRAVTILENAIRFDPEEDNRESYVRAYALLVEAMTRLRKPDAASLGALMAANALDEARGIPTDRTSGLDQHFVDEFLLSGLDAALTEGATGSILALMGAGRGRALIRDVSGRRILHDVKRLPAEIASWDKIRADLRRGLIDLRRARVGTDAKKRAKAQRNAESLAGRLADVARSQHRSLLVRAQLQPGCTESLDDLRGVLKPDEAVVTYAFTRGGLVALVMRKSSGHVVSLGSAGRINRVVESLSGAVWNSHRGRASPTPSILAARRALVDPLELAPDVRRVVVSLDGALHGAPIEMLFGVPTSRVASPSLLVLLRKTRPTRGKGILAVVNPDYRHVARGLQTTALRGTIPAAPKARIAAKLAGVNGRALRGKQANETELLRALATRPRWRAVDLGCPLLRHASRGPLTALALATDDESDGLLFGAEVSRMTISADLVVLSGRPRTTGMVQGSDSPTHAYLIAGAQAVLAPMRNSDAKATVALMDKFHEVYAKTDATGSPVTAMTAWQAAVTHVSGKKKWQHPYYWAGWLLVGDPD